MRKAAVAVASLSMTLVKPQMSTHNLKEIPNVAGVFRMRGLSPAFGGIPACLHFPKLIWQSRMRWPVDFINSKKRNKEISRS